MINRVRKFTDIGSLEHFLNGGIVGGPLKPDGYYGLVGQTLTFSAPAAAVTFVASSGQQPDKLKLTLSDLRTQIRAAAGLGAVNVANIGGNLAFSLDGHSGPVSFAANAEVARGILGFANTAIAGKVYTPPGVTPGSAQWTGGYSCNENCHVIYTWE